MSERTKPKPRRFEITYPPDANRHGPHANSPTWTRTFFSRIHTHARPHVRTHVVQNPGTFTQSSPPHQPHRRTSRHVPKSTAALSPCRRRVFILQPCLRITSPVIVPYIDYTRPARKKTKHHTLYLLVRRHSRPRTYVNNCNRPPAPPFPRPPQKLLVTTSFTVNQQRCRQLSHPLRRRWPPY